MWSRKVLYNNLFIYHLHVCPNTFEFMDKYICIQKHSSYLCHEVHEDTGPYKAPFAVKIRAINSPSSYPVLYRRFLWLGYFNINVYRLIIFIGEKILD